jgi:hypothetical protein
MWKVEFAHDGLRALWACGTLSKAQEYRTTSVFDTSVSSLQGLQRYCGGMIPDVLAAAVLAISTAQVVLRCSFNPRTVTIQEVLGRAFGTVEDNLLCNSLIHLLYDIKTMSRLPKRPYHTVTA